MYFDFIEHHLADALPVGYSGCSVPVCMCRHRSMGFIATDANSNYCANEVQAILVISQCQLHVHHLFLQCGSSVKVTHVPLFHSVVCPGVIVAPAHSTLLLPPLPPGGEEEDGNVEVEVRQCTVF